MDTQVIEDVKQSLLDWALETFLVKEPNGNTHYAVDDDSLHEEAEDSGLAAGLSIVEIESVYDDVLEELHFTEQDEASNYGGRTSDFRVQSDTPPKPTLPAGDGYQWVYDAKSKSWIKALTSSRKSLNETMSRMKASIIEEAFKELVLTMPFTKEGNWIPVKQSKEYKDEFKITAESVTTGDKVRKINANFYGRIIKSEGLAHKVRWDKGGEGFHWGAELLKVAESETSSDSENRDTDLLESDNKKEELADMLRRKRQDKNRKTTVQAK